MTNCSILITQKRKKSLPQI